MTREKMRVVHVGPSTKSWITHTQARRVLKRVTYVPLSVFKIRTYFGSPRLEIYTKRVNTSTKGPEKIWLRTWLWLPGGPKRILLAESELMKKVRQIVRMTEHHEIDEWLKVDGNKLRDPHTGQRYRPKVRS